MTRFIPDLRSDPAPPSLRRRCGRTPQVAGLLILAQNLVGTLFLAVPIDLLGTRWQIWAVVGSVAAGMLLMLGFLEDYRRLGVDRAAAGAKAAGAKAAGAMAADARAGSVTATGQIQGA